MAQLILWNTLNQGDLYTTRSIGCYQIASWARQCGFSAVVIDHCHRYTAEDLFKLTQPHIDSQTLAVGVSSTFWKPEVSLEPDPKNHHEPQWVTAARILIQEQYPDLSWILGGVNAVSQTGSRDYFDWIKIVTDHENRLIFTLRSLSRHDKSTDPVFDVKNITPVFTADDHIQPYEVLPIELGRGCKFRCKFCRYEMIGKQPGTYLRNKTHLQEEIVYNFENWGVTRYFFLDDTVNETPEKIQDLIDIRMKTGIEFEWIGYCRLDLIGTNKKTIKLLKDSGLKGAYFGIESFHEAASKLVGKGWNGRYGKSCLLELQDQWQDQISFTLAFIIGIGNENSEHIQQTHQWCIDQGIHRWRFNGLNLIRNRTMGNQSEFDINAELYGYRFTDPMRNHVWSSDHWTSQEAENLAKILNKDANNYAKLAAWQLGNTATTTGQQFSELMGVKVSDLNYAKLRQRSAENLHHYMNLKLKK